eukprot:CAMPEP_0204485830 /NCGR_PEP_ID=MMETSP0471-20130131/62184_1 /ASSEMBLY_ACC=CAM_ASM_000602 /TAXON_ID=2969 /ORGANISM="Oxyrrhis marina" /LENGTH=278 /DNA_ID=CAMNT_0051489371 /DNA_START=117 /DNA_END=955 /DNA_ORIENTATION=-
MTTPASPADLRLAWVTALQHHDLSSARLGAPTAPVQDGPLGDRGTTDLAIFLQQKPHGQRADLVGNPRDQADDGVGHGLTKGWILNPRPDNIVPRHSAQQEGDVILVGKQASPPVHRENVVFGSQSFTSWRNSAKVSGGLCANTWTAVSADCRNSSRSQETTKTACSKVHAHSSSSVSIMRSVSLRVCCSQLADHCEFASCTSGNISGSTSHSLHSHSDRSIVSELRCRRVIESTGTEASPSVNPSSRSSGDVAAVVSGVEGKEPQVSSASPPPSVEP